MGLVFNVVVVTVSAAVFFGLPLFVLGLALRPVVSGLRRRITVKVWRRVGWFTAITGVVLAINFSFVSFTALNLSHLLPEPAIKTSLRRDFRPVTVEWRDRREPEKILVTAGRIRVEKLSVNFEKEGIASVYVQATNVSDTTPGTVHVHAKSGLHFENGVFRFSNIEVYRIRTEPEALFPQDQQAKLAAALESSLSDVVAIDLHDEAWPRLLSGSDLMTAVIAQDGVWVEMDPSWAILRRLSGWALAALAGIGLVVLARLAWVGPGIGAAEIRTPTPPVRPGKRMSGIALRLGITALLIGTSPLYIASLGGLIRTANGCRIDEGVVAHATVHACAILGADRRDMLQAMNDAPGLLAWTWPFFVAGLLALLAIPVIHGLARTRRCRSGKPA